MSWEGHLSGFITGLVFAFLYKTKPLVETYSWEEEEYDKTEDPFMKHFDPNGNFIEFPNSEDNNDIKVNYKFKSDD